MRVGLTGGIGSGKSAVARLFSGWGAVVIDADVLARDAVGPDTPALGEIAGLWPEVVDPHGVLDRAALARIVFADAAARRMLTGIIHPRVRALAAAGEAAAPPGALVIHVVPLLFEGDFWETCDRNVLVRAAREVRLARVIARDGMAPEAIEARMAAQIDPDRAAALADYVIENSGDVATLERRARDVFDRLTAGAAV